MATSETFRSDVSDKVLDAPDSETEAEIRRTSVIVDLQSEIEPLLDATAADADSQHARVATALAQRFAEPPTSSRLELRSAERALAKTRPTIPQTYNVKEATGFVYRQSAGTDNTSGYDLIGASIGAVVPGGYAMTLTGLGSDIGVAPNTGAPTNLIHMSTTVVSSERALLICPGPSVAYTRAYARLFLGVVEYDENKNYVRRIYAPDTVVYDKQFFGLGIDVRIDESYSFALSADILVNPGYSYEVWLWASTVCELLGWIRGCVQLRLLF